MKDKALGALANMSSAQIVSTLALQQRPNLMGTPGIAGPGIPMHTMLASPGVPTTPVVVKQEQIGNPGMVSVSGMYIQCGCECTAVRVSVAVFLLAAFAMHSLCSLISPLIASCGSTSKLYPTAP